MLHCTLYSTADYRDAVEASRYTITIFKYILPFELDPNGSGATEPQQYPGYEKCLTTDVIESDVLQPFTFTSSTSLLRSVNKVCIVATNRPSENTYLSHVSTAKCFLDTQYPAMEPSPKEYNNSIFGKKFGFQSSNLKHSSASSL